MIALELKQNALFMRFCKDHNKLYVVNKRTGSFCGTSYTDSVDLHIATQYQATNHCRLVKNPMSRKNPKNH